MTKAYREEADPALLMALGKIMLWEDAGEPQSRIIFTNEELYAIKLALVALAQTV